MFSGISNVANPRQLRTGTEEVILKHSIAGILPGIRPRMLFVPQPLMDMPRRNGRVDSAFRTRLSLKSFEGRQNIAVPKLSCGDNSEVNVLNGPIRFHCVRSYCHSLSLISVRIASINRLYCFTKPASVVLLDAVHPTKIASDYRGATLDCSMEIIDTPEARTAG